MYDSNSFPGIVLQLCNSKNAGGVWLESLSSSADSYAIELNHQWQLPASCVKEIVP